MNSPQPPKPSMADIAQIAQVSLATVSMALSDHPNVNSKTKERVLQVSRELGYQRTVKLKSADSRPAKALRYGIVDMGVTGWEAPSVSIVQHLSRAGIPQGIRFEYLGLPRSLSPQEVISEALQFSVGLDGLILTNLVSAGLCRSLREASITHVVVGHMVGPIYAPSNPAATTVAFDETAMAYWSVEHLLRQGHTRIAFITEAIFPGVSHDRWFRGYKLALAEAGIPFDPDLACVTGMLHSGAGPALDPLLALRNPPTAYSIPDKRIASTLLDQLSLRNIQLPPGSVVFHSHDMPQSFEPVSRQTWVYGQADVMSQQIIVQLNRSRHNPQATPVTVLIPFNVYNLPSDSPATSLQAPEA
jgi:LacI family transcriptional regulator